MFVSKYECVPYFQFESGSVLLGPEVLLGLAYLVRYRLAAKRCRRWFTSLWKRFTKARNRLFRHIFKVFESVSV